MFNILSRVRSNILNIAHQIGDRIQHSLKPGAGSLVVGIVRDTVRSKAQLIAENASCYNS